jgi:hypothetical protein
MTAWGEPVAGLRLGIDARGGAVVELALENTGDGALQVLSHVLAAGEDHLDWFTVHVGERELRLLDERNRSAAVRVTLAPGEAVRHTVNLAAWALRPPNGARSLSPGPASATYDVPATPDTWSGHLESGRVELPRS